MIFQSHISPSSGPYTLPTVSYTHLTYTYTVTPKEEAVEAVSGTLEFTETTTKTINLREVTAIAVKTLPDKTNYYVGEKLDTTGLVLTVTYGNGESDEITEGFSVSGFSSDVETDSLSVTVSYHGQTAQFQVSVGAKPFPSAVFQGLAGKAEVTYSHNSSYQGEDGQEFIDAEEGVLKSNSAGMSSSEVTINITIAQSIVEANLSFDYKVSSEGSWSVYDGLRINGGSKIGGKVDWTTHTMTVKGGDTVTLTYVKDYSGNSGDDCVYFRNFQLAELNAMTFTLEPADAEIILAPQAGGDAIAPISREGGTVVYSLADGVYTYTISKFGYDQQQGTITVPDESAKTITLTESALQTVTFRVDLPEGIEAAYTITVKSGDNVMSATAEPAVYHLPSGDYTYTVTCEGCDVARGEFTVADQAVAVPVQLLKSLIFADFFQPLTDTLQAENSGSYKFEPVRMDENNSYLQSSNETTGSVGTITLQFTKPARLSFEYWLSEEGSTYSSGGYGLIIEKNGQQIEEKEGISEDWETYTLDVNAGETVAISYRCYAGYDWNAQDENFLRLKNFKAEPLCAVTFDGVPEGATIVLEQEGQVYQPYAGTTYLLKPGAYQYAIQAFGYLTKTEQTLTVLEQPSQTVTVALEQAESNTITFSLPSGATVQVVHSSAGDMEAFRVEDTNAFRLPVGEAFTYTVSQEGYLPKTGNFTVSGDQTIAVAALESAGAAWDGSTKTPITEKEGDVYLIDNAAELAWFAQQVNQEDAAISGKLTANINLNEKSWTSMGSYNQPFLGTFDGDGFVISGLVGTNGLFDTVGVQGTVKGVSVLGNISGSGNVGGIAGTSSGIIENCLFSGSISNSSGSGSLGGIVGRSQGADSVIRGCINTGAVNNTYQLFAASLNTGGIVGYTYGKVENCYHAGTVSAQSHHSDGRPLTNHEVGGLIGQAYGDAVIQNCYTVGTVIGPEDGFGVVIGTNQGTVTNVYYLSTINGPAIAANTASQAPEILAKSAADMKDDQFAYDLGSAFSVDDEGLNAGYPVLSWQGGRAPQISSDAEIVAKDKAALALKNSDGALLTADSTGKYAIQTPLTLDLPSLGENGSEIVWSCTPEEQQNLDLITGELTLPQEDKVELTLTATITKGNAQDTKTFVLVLWSEASQGQDFLAQIKEKVEASGVFIQPLEAYGHTNIRQAMEQYLMRQGYAVDMAEYSYDNEDGGIRVEFVNSGRQTYPGNTTNYLDPTTGAITYYTGAGDFGLNYVQYQDVTFRLWMGGTPQRNENAPGKPVIQEDGQWIEVKVRVHIGWDSAYIENRLDEAVATITWDTIRGGNENSATVSQEAGSWWQTVTVEGQVAQDLILPIRLQDFGDVTVKWSSPDTDALYVSDNGDGTYTATLNRPPFGGEPFTFTLTATTTFNRLDDYTRQEATVQGVEQDWYTGVKNFVITVAPNDVDQSAAINAALENYPSLLKDFVQGTAVDVNAITDDLQMPTPGTLETAGIMPDRYNQKVTMVSNNTDVLEFNGYHALIYRPLPGEEAVDVEYTVMISDRRNGATLGQKTFSLTVLPLTEEELTAATDFMNRVCTEDVYWNGIKGENIDKKQVTTDLNPFAEILPGSGNEVQYIYGAINLTFGGAEVDDLPGYDPMNAQPWREYRSSRPTIISCESLLVERPEYDTEVTLDSVLTHSTFGKYWTKFSAKPAYAQFEQFYQRPVSVTVTVKGTEGSENPHPTPDRIQATVNIDGGGFENFHNTSGYKFTGSANQDWTVWDALEKCLQQGGYTYTGSGYYIQSLTDSHGVCLEELEHGSNSGWMYRVNGELPDLPLNQVYLKDGDQIEFFYTGDYQTVPGGHGGSSSNAVENVEKLIAAIGEITKDSGAKIQAAREAYDKLTDAQKKLVDNYETLTKAEATYAELTKDLPEGLPFTDVSGHWALTAIQYVYEHGLMAGVENQKFEPNGTLNRAMLVTILYRQEGEPTVSGDDLFSDVPAEAWYTKAVIWGSSNGIINGVGDNKFAPMEKITREEMATMLYRYAEYKGYDISKRNDLTNYTDVDAISSWALTAVQWANAEALLSGSTATTILPNGTATRAEAATMLMRFAENLVS